MAGTIKTISDRSEFDRIFYDNFPNNDVFLKTSNGNLKIAFLGYSDGQVAFRIPYIKSMPDTALVFTRKNEMTIYAEIRTIEKQEAEVFVFTPKRMQIIFASRREDRTPAAGKEGKSLLFITNIASDFNLFDCISLEKKKVEIIKERVLTDLKKMSQFANVYFCNEDAGDQRMRYFKENSGAPLVITHIDQKPPAGKEASHAFYKEFIFSKEQFSMRRHSLVSEITVPVLYHGMIPFGFIQIKGTAPLNPSYVQILQRAALLSEQMMVKGGVMKDICTERLLVADLSRLGNGIVFKDRKYIKFFKEKNAVFYEMILP
ncbi:MAG: hypothetical protein ACRCUT_13495, partial [Spirochaetota bacterium]